MEIRRTPLKKMAKDLMKETKPSPVLVTLVLLIITEILSVLSNRLSKADEFMDILMSSAYNGVQGYAYYFDMPRVSGSAVAVVILIALFNFMLSFGYSIYVLNVSRKLKSGPENLFDGFQILFKVLWLNILMSMLVFLWGMVFIIPGILAALRYSQAVFILIDNPELSALECIGRSKYLMARRKGEFFTMLLSFFPWYLLINLVSYTMGRFDFPYAAIVVFTGVFSLWLTPYMGITRANYYNALIGLERIGPVVEYPAGEAGMEDEGDGE